MIENNGKSDIIVNTEEDKNFKYADVAIHCSHCNSIYKITDPNFQKIQTGIFITANKNTHLSFGCPECKTVLSLVFIETSEPVISDAEIVEEIKNETKNEVDTQ